MKKQNKTSWGGVADWYDAYLEETGDTYQKQVILPNLLRILDLKAGQKVADVACGQGFFAREFAKLGAKISGADISEELVKLAATRSPKEIKFYATPAHKLFFSRDGEFDSAVMVLAIQNIENPNEVFAEIKRVLKPGGKFILVMNHPAFRVPQKSSWGFDEVSKTQYRRIDNYLSGSKIPILMHPGRGEKSKRTFSYHRSLQDFFKLLNKSGFAVFRLEEWISHKKSGKGPRQKAEDTTRKEIPLFLMLEARKVV